MNKLAEHNEVLERAVLGCVMVDNKSIDKIKDRLGSDDFFLQKHQIVYRAMIKLRTEGKGIDLITLQDVLGKFLAKIGGISFIASLAEDVPTASRIEHYAESVKAISVKRQLMNECQKILESADVEVEGVLSDFSQKISDLSVQSVWDSKSEEDILTDYLDWYAEREKRKQDGCVGIGTGNTWIDKRVIFDRKELVTLAGRPGMGKSALALDLIIGMAQNGFKCLFLSLEMDPFKNINRALANTTDLPFGAIENCNVKNIADAMEKYQEHTKGNLIIRGLRNPTFERIRSVCSGFDVVVIDQLSSVKLPDSSAETKPSKLTTLCYDFLNMSQDHDQLVVLCHQIGRAGDKEPQLIHLKDSGGVEEASLKVIFVHRKSENKKIAHLICAKNRNGEADHKVNYRFDAEHMKFRPQEK